MARNPLRVETEQQFDWRIQSDDSPSGRLQSNRTPRTTVSLPQNLPPLAYRTATAQTSPVAPPAPSKHSPVPPPPAKKQPLRTTAEKVLRPTAPPRPRRVRKPAPCLRLSRPKWSTPRIAWKWPMFWLAVLGGLSGTGLLALLWLTNLPPLPDCKTLPSLASDSDRLYCAREAIQSGGATALVAGLQVIQPWGENHPLYREAQPLLKSWSDQLLAIARQKVELADLEGAVTLAWKIPRTSPVYAEAQKAIVEWRSQWNQGETIIANAQKALQQQEWKVASEQLLALGGLPNDYWRIRRLDELTRRIVVERTAAENLQKAQKLAKGNHPERLAQAIALVQQIDSSTYIWPQAAPRLTEWSMTLANTALTLWQSGDQSGAIALAQQIPVNVELPGDAKDLVILSHATQLASVSDVAWKPSLEQVWGLREAIAALRRIAPSSPFYAQAQVNLRDREAQLQDMMQLQYASAIASLSQQSALELAIQQAQQIGADRPQRNRAQTLIAHWGLEIQRLQDLPYLARARSLAAPGTIPALRQAIAAAQQVPQNRALRTDADTAIAQWMARIETIEDQPIFDRARQLADQNRLRDAIQEARKIEPDRALYDSAQVAIASWRNTIEQAEIALDRKIMDEANSLAARGRLSLAIEAASRIGSERPLYSEARSAIASWSDQRDQIWADWGASNGVSGDQVPANAPSDSYVNPDDSGLPQ